MITRENVEGLPTNAVSEEPDLKIGTKPSTGTDRIPIVLPLEPEVECKMDTTRIQI